MRHRGDSTRRLTAFLLFLILILAGCRTEAERSALAQAAPDVPPPHGGADGPGPVIGEAGVRRVWSSENVDFYGSSISPDGRYVTETDDMAVRDLATGLLHRLTDKGPWEESLDYFVNARFSPDGRRVAYAWYDAGEGDYAIGVLDFRVDAGGPPRGTAARIVYDASRPEPANYVYDWLSDDDVLVGVYRAGGGEALARLSLSTGSLQVLKSFGWNEGPGQVWVSPDRRFIAYDQAVESDPANRDIYVLSVEGDRVSRVVDGPGVDVVLGWAPHERSLLFHTWRSGEGSIWRLPMSDGRASGPATLVRDGITAPIPIGFAGDVFHYGLVVESRTFVTASIDFDNGRVSRLPTRFEAPTGGRIRTFAWSPDGRHALWEIDHPRVPDTWIQLRRADGGLVREWKFDMWLMFTLFRWAPDGGSVLVSANDSRERPGLIRIDLATGELEMVRRMDGGGELGRVFAISPDGGKLYFTRFGRRDGKLDESSADVVERDLATGTERAITRVRDHGALTLSPDGRWLALAVGSRKGARTIEVIPVEAGEARTVYTGDTSMAIYLPWVLGWSADSGSLLFLDRLPSDDKTDMGLYRVAREGADAQRIVTIHDYKGGGNLHPDGRTIAYRTGEDRGETWALEGLGGGSDTHAGGDR